MAIQFPLIGAITAIALCGCAATGSTIPVSASAQDPGCVPLTASRISGKASCESAGRSYSSQDIQRTGATNAGDALALLDPSLTVHR